MLQVHRRDRHHHREDQRDGHVAGQQPEHEQQAAAQLGRDQHRRHHVRHRHAKRSQEPGSAGDAEAEQLHSAVRGEGHADDEPKQRGAEGVAVKCASGHVISFQNLSVYKSRDARDTENRPNDYLGKKNSLRAAARLLQQRYQSGELLLAQVTHLLLVDGGERLVERREQLESGRRDGVSVHPAVARVAPSAASARAPRACRSAASHPDRVR